MSSSQKQPMVSVVLPIYNAEKYLADAVKSILNQEFTDFELLLVDDGSTDHTASLIQNFLGDRRVRVLQNKNNMGIIACLNRAYTECRAPLIARMDADDISDPLRLARQVSFMQDHPEVSIVGGAIRFFGNVKPNVFQFPRNHAAIRPAMLFFCPLAHPAIMFRRELVERGLIYYDNDFLHAEDYHLWSHLLLRVTSANLSDVVLDYRLHALQVSSNSSDKQYAASLRVRKQMLLECGLAPSEEEIALHESVILQRPLRSIDYMQRLGRWFGRIESVNAVSQYWDSSALHTLLKSKFLETAQLTNVNMQMLASQVDTAQYVSLKDIALFSTQPKIKAASRVKRLAKDITRHLLGLIRKL